MKKSFIKIILSTAIFAFCAGAFAQDWISNEVPSFKDTYKDLFEYVGFACEYGIKGWSEKELATDYVQQGMKKHSSTITMGNEFKPQFLMAWWGQNPKLEGFGLVGTESKT